VRFSSVFRLRQNTTQLRNKDSLCQDTAHFNVNRSKRAGGKTALANAFDFPCSCLSYIRSKILTLLLKFIYAICYLDIPLSRIDKKVDGEIDNGRIA